MSTNFTALLVEEQTEKTFTRSLQTRSTDQLPEGDLLIKVAYSSLNYKDALSAIGNKGVTRNYPHTPGIDAAGEVVTSASDQFAPKDKVVVTGYDLGMETDGGFGQYIRIPAEWALPLPANLTLAETMMLGTAGFTAALSLWHLEQHGITPQSGEVLVTGATGGVGSLATAMLSQTGYQVAAVTGKQDQHDFLREMGAQEVIHRNAFLENAKRPLLKERWAAAVDTVGGDILAQVLKTLKYGGAASCCGLTAGGELNTTVFPFILRGVSLLGVDSVQCPKPIRKEIWQRLGGDWKPSQLQQMSQECSLEQLDSKIEAILQGQLSGRVLVNLQS